MEDKRNEREIIVGNLNVRDHLQDLGVDMDIIKMVLKEAGCQHVIRIQLAQDTIQCGFFLNTIIKLNFIRRRFRLKNVEVTGEWRKVHNGEFHNLSTSTNIIGTIK
jgi:hypothetical protein